MSETETLQRRARRLRRAGGAIAVAAALTVAGCSSGGAKTSLNTSTDTAISTHATSSKKHEKKHDTDTDSSGFLSDTGGFDSDTSGFDSGGDLNTTGNLATDMHEQMEDTGEIDTTSASTFTAGDLSFEIPAGWVQGTDDNGNSIIVNQRANAKVTVLQDPSYDGGGAIDELKSLEQELADTVKVIKEEGPYPISGGNGQAALFAGTLTDESDYGTVVVAVTTSTEAYALLATFPTANADAVTTDLGNLADSISVG